MPWDDVNNPRKSTLPANWSKLRLRILKRDGKQCQIRGRRCLGKATDVDHVSDPLDHSDANLQSACGPCHRHKTAKQGAAASTVKRQEMAAAKFRPKNRHPGLLTDEQVDLKRAALGMPPIDRSKNSSSQD